MAQFRDYLEREGVETEEEVELQLTIWANEQFLKRGLVVPRPDNGLDFTKETALMLEIDPAVRVSEDMSAKAQTLESGDAQLQSTEIRSGAYQTIPDKSYALINWERAYLNLLGYKERKGLKNLIITQKAVRLIVEKGNYKLVADKAVIAPRSFQERELLQEAVIYIQAILH